MNSRKYLIYLGISLSLLFYASALLILRQRDEDDSLDTTFVLAEQMRGLHQNFFLRHGQAERLIDDYVAGKLDGKEFEANFATHDLDDIYAVTGGTPRSLTGKTSQPELPRELYARHRVCYIRPGAKNALGFDCVYNRKMKNGRDASYIGAFSLAPATLEKIRAAFPFDYTVLQLEDKYDAEIVKTSLDDERAAWVKKNFVRDLAAIGGINIQAPFEEQLEDRHWKDAAENEYIAVKHAVSYTPELKQFVVYTLPALQNAKGAVLGNLFQLSLFFAASVFITIGSILWSRRDPV